MYNLTLQKPGGTMQEIGLFIQHHYMLAAALSVVLVLLIILEFFKQKQGANTLSPAAATQLINHNKAVVVDIRNHEAFLSGHIIGAISLPFSEIKDKNQKLEKFKSQPLVLVCAMGNESPRAATQLAQQGYITHILSGGIRAWKEASMPLVKG